MNRVVSLSDRFAVIGDKKIGELIAQDRNIALVSATGSTAMGKKVAAVVAQRLGKSILELGGNNAIILTANADLKLALLLNEQNQFLKMKSGTQL